MFQLKGCPSWEAENKVSEMIKMLHLEDKAGVDAKLLSGGLKRKLCVGIALIADSKAIKNCHLLLLDDCIVYRHLYSASPGISQTEAL